MPPKTENNRHRRRNKIYKKISRNPKIRLTKTTPHYKMFVVMRPWRNRQTRTFEGRMGDRMSSSLIGRTNKKLGKCAKFFFIAHASLRSLVRDLQRRQIRWGSSLHSSHAMHRSGVRCLSVAKKFAEAPVYGKRQYPLISTIRKAKV